MILGRPLFKGMSEIEQLFQIFSVLGTPHTENVPEEGEENDENNENNSTSWATFTSMPNFQYALFPQWKNCQLSTLVLDKSSFCSVPERSDALDLLGKLLVCDPSARLTAVEALRHPLLCGSNDSVVTPAQPQVYRPSRLPQNTSRQTNSLPSAIQWESTIDWLLDACDNFRDSSSSRRREYFAVEIFKKYVDFGDDNHSTTWEQERLLYDAAACLHIASKLEDVCFLSAKDILRSLPVLSDRWTLSRLLLEEEIILSELQFDLYPTEIALIGALLQLIGDTTTVSAAVLSFMYMLGDMCLLFAPRFAHYSSAQLAASIHTYAARCFTTNPAATAVVDDITNSKCYHSLVEEHVRFYLDRNSTLFHRFSRSDNHEVAHVAPRR